MDREKGVKRMADDRQAAATATAHADLIARILDVMPDWATATVQLNEVVAARLGLSTTDLHCLHALNTGGPATAGTLAQRVGRTTGAVTRMLDRLDRAGYIRRVPDPSDRRRVVVEPTEAGLSRAGEYYAGMGERAMALLAAFDEPELGAILRYITQSRDDARTEATRLRADADERPA